MHMVLSENKEKEPDENKWKGYEYSKVIQAITANRLTSAHLVPLNPWDYKNNLTIIYILKAY